MLNAAAPRGHLQVQVAPVCHNEAEEAKHGALIRYRESYYHCVASVVRNPSI